MGGKPPLVKGLFFQFAESQVLTGLTHSTDSVFLDAESVTELGGGFSAGDARATCESQRAGPPEGVEGDFVEAHFHHLTFHAFSMGPDWTFVQKFLQIFV